MIRILPSRHGDVPNAELLADRLREEGTPAMENFAEWVQRLPDDDRRIMQLDFAHCFRTGRCILSPKAQECVETWQAAGVPSSHSVLLQELADAAREDWKQF